MCRSQANDATPNSASDKTKAREETIRKPDSCFSQTEIFSPDELQAETVGAPQQAPDLRRKVRALEDRLANFEDEYKHQDDLSRKIRQLQLQGQNVLIYTRK